MILDTGIYFFITLNNRMTCWLFPESWKNFLHPCLMQIFVSPSPSFSTHIPLKLWTFAMAQRMLSCMYKCCCLLEKLPWCLVVSFCCTLKPLARVLGQQHCTFSGSSGKFHLTNSLL